MRTTPYALSAVLLLATACGGGGRQGAAPAAAIQVPIQAPIAHAGPDQAVSSGATVAQDGSASTDFSGLPLTYAWTAPAGITLSATSVA
ncbi:MAG: PKD domain-containing protein, partial [Acidobacteria bacterium]|nr:PKD domain-containing protein [Acidobacteriota bacterium]